MNSKVTILDRLSALSSDDAFAMMASEIFHFQRENNEPFGKFVNEVYRSSSMDLDSPPFLPIELFKNARVSCYPTEEATFKSSGTTADLRSEHHVADLGLYEALATRHFEALYGPLRDLVVLSLLPSYVENGGSSLVFMVDRFMRKADPGSQFVLHQPEILYPLLSELQQSKQPTVLFGVSYALLDAAEQFYLDFPALTIIETGGMKGRRIELTRDALHAGIRRGFPTSNIHSEYGMTELLSQGYMQHGKSFTPPFWMRAFATDISDPLNVLDHGKRGLLAFVDLANYHSCSFIQTQDIGTVYPDRTFSVDGRLDTSDLRGCNLLYT
ncbi:MAG: acyl transferase [Cryomorphaceae bacterium]